MALLVCARPLPLALNSLPSCENDTPYHTIPITVGGMVCGAHLQLPLHEAEEVPSSCRTEHWPRHSRRHTHEHTHSHTQPHSMMLPTSAVIFLCAAAAAAVTSCTAAATAPLHTVAPTAAPRTVHGAGRHAQLVLGIDPASIRWHSLT